jgi:hypothetical protein
MTDFTPEYEGDTPNAEWVRERVRELGLEEWIAAQAHLVYLARHASRPYVNVAFQALLLAEFPDGIAFSGYDPQTGEPTTWTA